MFSWLSSLRVRLLFLVVLAALPALGLQLYTASRQRELAVDEAKEDARRLAALAAADNGRLIEGTRQLLVVLARLPEVRGGNPEVCETLLADLKNQFPLYANLGVIAPDGNLACSAVPPAEPTNLGDRGYFRRAVETRDFVVGEYQIGRITGLPTVNCSYPVLDEAGNLLAVVYAALDLSWLNRFASEGGLPDEAVLTVFDRAGVVLVRYPNPESWIGRSVAGTPVVDTVLTQGTGVTETSNEESGAQIYAFVPLRAGGTDVYLSIAIPRARAVASAERAFSDSVTRLGLIATLVLVAAWVGADLLARRDADTHKAVVRRVYEAFATGGVDSLDDVVAHDFVDHDPIPGQAPGVAGLKQAVGLFRAAFPDGQLKPEELVAEGNKVMARVTLRGTQVGDFLGAQATGRPMIADGVETFRLAGGKVVEAWSRFGPLTPASDSATPADGAASMIDPGTDPRR